MTDRIEDSAEYKRIYSKWSSHRGAGGADAATQAVSGNYTNIRDLTGEKVRETQNVVAGGVPAIETADPNEPVTAAPRLTVHSEKLDNFRICRRCQGAGEYKEYLEMGHGATREIVKGCQSDIDGAPCDGGIVPKNWKPGQSWGGSTEDKACKPCKETSNGKFDGNGAASKETEMERASIDSRRQQQAAQALRGVQPVWRVQVVPAKDEDDEAWVEVEVELPLVASSAEIEACVEHMRFLEVQVPGRYSLRVELPEYVDDEDMECTFAVESHILKVRVPVVDVPVGN